MRPHALTFRFVGSPLLPALRGGIRGRAFRLVILTHVVYSSLLNVVLHDQPQIRR
jgi:hypothetical protein